MQTVQSLIEWLAQNGCNPYFVGGCVRDRLLGLTPQDFDLTVSSLPEQTAAVLRGAGLSPVADAARYGTIRVETENGPVEITTYREESQYTDSRRPDEVRFTADLSKDLGRRDFTINAMAQAPDGTLVDRFGGQKDLQDRQIRMVGDPRVRLEEDHLRILRAVRFANRLDFALDSGLEDAVRALAGGVASLSNERVGGELMPLLLGPRAGQGLRMLVDLGLYESLFPTCAPQDDPDRIDRLPREALPRLSFLVWSRPTGAVYDLLRRLNTPKTLFDDVLLLTMGESEELIPTAPAARRLLRAYGGTARALLEVRDVFGMGCAPMQRLLEQSIQSGDCVRLADLALKGDDLIEAGVQPGRAVGITLSRLLDEVIEDPLLNDRDVLLRRGLDFCIKEGYI
ncbi:MAG: CCA tRNA nucleotidyltransferase [Clostridia bacterium]|nr:CCA tRNA nucleotidyltransferase [Clostridia bacterium]